MKKNKKYIIVGLILVVLVLLIGFFVYQRNKRLSGVTKKGDSLEANDSVYTTYMVDNVVGNRYSVLVAKGKHNYVSVRKETNNPYKGAGIDFKNFDEAVKHYKSPEMKLALLQIETGLV